MLPELQGAGQADNSTKIRWHPADGSAMDPSSAHTREKLGAAMHGRESAAGPLGDFVLVSPSAICDFRPWESEGPL